MHRRCSTTFMLTHYSPRHKSCGPLLSLFWKLCVDQFVLFADPLWPIHWRRRRDRPRLSQPASRKNIIGSPPSLPSSTMAADCRNVDHRAHYRKHIHVPPAAYSDRDALVGPILLPLSPKVGILSQGNAPSMWKTIFWVDAETLVIGTEAPAEDARTNARRCAR
jgi:hypothetical protein